MDKDTVDTMIKESRAEILKLDKQQAEVKFRGYAARPVVTMDGLIIGYHGEGGKIVHPQMRTRKALKLLLEEHSQQISESMGLPAAVMFSEQSPKQA